SEIRAQIRRTVRPPAPGISWHVAAKFRRQLRSNHKAPPNPARVPRNWRYRPTLATRPSQRVIWLKLPLLGQAADAAGAASERPASKFTRSSFAAPPSSD